MADRNIALVVVHGVADQKPGESADAVANLLVAAARTRPATAPEVPVIDAEYAAIARHSLVLGVDPLEPRPASRARTDATPRGSNRSVVKSVAQSFRCDFQRPDWRAPSHLPSLKKASAAPAESHAEDRGVARSNYLLTKSRDNGALRSHYETASIELARTDDDGSRAKVVVYEMYWADLSRLSGVLPRILTEIFTMIFRLSQLGRDTVDEARRTLARQRGAGRHGKPSWYRGAWAATTTLQIVLDWLFVNGLALLFAQLFLLALLLAAAGAAASADPERVHRIVAAAVAIFGLLFFGYRHRDEKTRSLVWPLLLAGFGALALAFEALRPLLTAMLLLSLLTAAYEAVLRVCDDRFPLVHLAGRCIWAAVVGVVLVSACNELSERHWTLADRSAFHVHGHAALFAVEVTLLVIKWLWVTVSLLMVFWLAGSLVAASEPGYEARGSIVTGRLGLSLSFAFFLAVAMALWAVLTPLLEVSTRGLAYSPCIFGPAPSSALERAQSQLVRRPARPAGSSAGAGAAAANVCLWTTEDARSAKAATPAGADAPIAATATASIFLADRYRGGTAPFSSIAAVLLIFVAFLAAMVTPSILAELKVLGTTRRAKKASTDAARLLKQDLIARTRRLGRWLTAGFRNLSGVGLTVASLGVAMGAATSAFIVGAYFAPDLAAELESGFRDLLTDTSQFLLRPLVITAISIGGAFTLLGGLLSRYLPALRAPLDIALDVDNHLREFPRKHIPRAQIFSRFAALLRHVALVGHDRVVIVAHSQGAVISAELLRFLSSDGKSAPAPGATPTIGTVPLPEVNLLTLGCPLRQLYAARFPTLYRWVIARRGEVTGPLAADVGVARWVNAFCSGDYVGRWLWSDSPVGEDQDPLGHPLCDDVTHRRFGRDNAYDGLDPMPPCGPSFGTSREAELCLGLGAHNRYFDAGQAKVAWLIDHLLIAKTRPAVAET